METDYYREAKELLLQLHAMYADGKDQTSAANEIRCKMEVAERHLNSLQQERLDGLSSDLYMLTGDEVKDSSGKEYSPREFVKYYRAKNWDRVLEILRLNSLRMDEHWVASTRMVCWAASADYDVALKFAEHALKLQPDNAHYRTFAQLYRWKVNPDSKRTVSNEMSNPTQQEIEQELFQEMSILQTA